MSLSRLGQDALSMASFCMVLRDFGSVVRGR